MHEKVHEPEYLLNTMNNRDNPLLTSSISIFCPSFFYTNIRKRKVFKKIIPSLLKETQLFIPYECETEKLIKELSLEDVFIKDDFDILIEDYDKKYTL